MWTVSAKRTCFVWYAITSECVRAPPLKWIRGGRVLC